MKIKLTNTGTEPVYYSRQYSNSTPTTLRLNPGESIKGHAVTYNADSHQITLRDHDVCNYFSMDDSVTHTLE